MAQDRSYDRGRAWRGGNEEEGGYGERGFRGSEHGLDQPRYGRVPGEPSRGNVEYREVRHRGDRDRSARNPSYRGSGADAYVRESERGPHTGRGPRGYTRSDERISEEINEALTENPYLDATEIEVRVERGEVTLEGTVDGRRAKRLAEEIADSVAGVLDVHNRLRVETGGRPDPDPADAPTL